MALGVEAEILVQLVEPAAQDRDLFGRDAQRLARLFFLFEQKRELMRVFFGLLGAGPFRFGLFALGFFGFCYRFIDLADRLPVNHICDAERQKCDRGR